MHRMLGAIAQTIVLCLDGSSLQCQGSVDSRERCFKGEGVVIIEGCRKQRSSRLLGDDEHIAGG